MDTLLRVVLYALMGAGIGTVSGTFGIGGGVLLIPLLMWLFDFKFDIACGTTLAIFVLPVGLPAALKYHERNQVDVLAAIVVAVSLAAGAYLGASLRGHVPEELLRRLFGILLLYIAMHYLIGSQSEVAVAGAAVLATATAWLLFLILRAIGRKHLPRPSLAAHISRAKEQGFGGAEYHI
jgi:uncharacterized membrane protein YfcA